MLTKLGSATQSLVGANITYTGPTYVNNGTLLLSNTTAFASSVITNNARVVMLADGNNAAVVSSILSGPGAWIVDGPGGGTVYQNRVILRGNGSDNTGTVRVVNSGKLWLDQAGRNVIGDAAMVDLGINSSFYIYQGVNETIGGLTGSGRVYGGDAAGTSVLTVGGGNQSATFDGILANNVIPITLVKIGTGTQTLTGTNIYSGVTSVSNGVLKVAATGYISNSAAIHLSTPGVLDVADVPGFTLTGVQTLQGFGSVTGNVATMPGTRLAPGLITHPAR